MHKQEQQYKWLFHKPSLHVAVAYGRYYISKLVFENSTIHSAIVIVIAGEKS